MSVRYTDSFRYGRVRLLKRAPSGIWYVRYKHPKKNKTVEESLGTDKKKDAVRLADDLNVQIINGTIGVADGTIPVKSLIQRFLEAKEGRIKPSSLKRLKTSIKAFTTWLDSNHPDVELAKHIDAPLMRKFQADRVNQISYTKRPLTRTSANNTIKNLNTMFKWAVREGYIQESPADYSRNGCIDLYKVPKRQHPVYTDEQVENLIKAAELKEDFLTRDLIIVLAGTGMRFSEATNLLKSSLDWSSAVPCIIVRALENEDGETYYSPKHENEVKYIPMLPDVEKVMRRLSDECEDENDLLFKNSVGNMVCGNRPLERLQKLFPDAGIKNLHRLGWHSFRRYFAKKSFQCGIPFHVIMSWTGHDSVQMLLHYAETVHREEALREFGKLRDATTKSRQ